VTSIIVMPLCIVFSSVDIMALFIRQKLGTVPPNFLHYERMV